MGDLTAKCDWHDSTLSIVLPDDPERIAVRLFDSRHAPARMYVPEVDALQLQAENAKLRELVRTLHHCAARGECDVCAMRDGRGLDDDTVCFAAHDRMRELGVEV